jgi:FixJ family two-component response regulator
VDDEESVRRALSRLVRSVGLAVETFPTAQAFLERERADRPACLVLDVRLPGLSGLDLQVSLGPRQEILPIIFITGRGSIPMSVRAMKDGALDFLRKPVESQELLDAIRRALVRSRDALGRQTAREREVLDLVVAGMLNKQIAVELGAAEKTIKVHRGRVMKKMEADSVADLVRMTQKASLAAAHV